MNLSKNSEYYLTTQYLVIICLEVSSLRIKNETRLEIRHFSNFNSKSLGIKKQKEERTTTSVAVLNITHPLKNLH